MAKQVRKRAGFIWATESMIEKQARNLMNTAKKEYERFEARAKTAKNENQKHTFLSQAYGGLMMAGAMAQALRDQVDRARESFLKKNPSRKPVKGPVKKKSARQVTKKASSAKKKTPSRAPRKAQTKKIAHGSSAKKRR
jgi:hypothetical protein